MLYCEPYDNIRTTELIKCIEDIDLGICYRDNSTSPNVLSVQLIDKNRRCQNKGIIKPTWPAEANKQKMYLFMSWVLLFVS